MGKYLSDEEVHDLVTKAKTGDNAAWEAICKNFDRYVHERAWTRLKKFDMTDAYSKQLEEDLYMAGWQGFVSAIKNFNPGHGKLLTYATHYIDGEISKELDRLLNPLGLTERPKLQRGSKATDKISRVSLDAQPNLLSIVRKDESGYEVSDAPAKEKYNAERRALQILEVLKILTDENHSISKDELGRMLRLYRIAKYENGTPLESPNTITGTLESILQELDPMEYSVENDHKYRIKYDGYKEDRLKNKINKEKGKKASDISGFSYVHIFDNDELDKLLQLISFSDMLSLDEKTGLIEKLVGTASANYKSPFWDGEKIRFNPQAIHGRFSNRRQEDKNRLSESLRIVQAAINNMGQIRFTFNCYTEDHSIVPKTEFRHTLSPYHLVVYHDNYYCIGLKTGDKRVWHYRVDLMTEVEIVRDQDGKIIPMEVAQFEGLPILNTGWNPEKYMSEHLNMAYDEPRDIHIKIKNTDYTILHDWFGDHYEKEDETVGVDDDGNEIQYDIVKVRTSPSMIVHWAMQYGDAVEIMDEEIRELIKRDILRIQEVYE